MYTNLNNPNQTYDVSQPWLFNFLKSNLVKLIKLITILIALLLLMEYASYYYVYTNDYIVPPNASRHPDLQLEYTQLRLSANAQTSNLCPLVPPNLVGRTKVMKQVLSFSELERLHPELEPGGHHKPKDCIARQKVAIIIPYRDREAHLKVFLRNFHPILQRQQADYAIFVIEQYGNSSFNRAKLFNVGFKEALRQYDFTCFIFHDVDLIAEDDRNFYRCSEQPRHMSVAINTMRYRLPYKDIFGGVSALSKTQMEVVNGFSNIYWGWGGEDDDMASRIHYYGYQITRYPPDIARYTMMSHKKETPNPERYRKLYQSRIRLKTDGLNSLHYKRIDLIYKKLYTWILVDLLPPKKKL